MSCYAWRGDGGRAELLYDHLTGAYRVAKDRWETEALARKLSRMTGLDEEVCREAILAAILFHDLGKAAEEYQRQCRTSACESFYQHYLVSALYLHAVLAKGLLTPKEANRGQLVSNVPFADNLDAGGTLARLILLPVTFHHYHQIAGLRSLEYKERQGHFEIEECAECLRELAGFVRREFKRLRGLEVVEDLPGLLRDRGVRTAAIMFVQNLSEEIREAQKRPPEPFHLLAAIEAITGLVNLCDGIVASRARR